VGAVSASLINWETASMAETSAWSSLGVISTR
jgi:hypothetical protein